MSIAFGLPPHLPSLWRGKNRKRSYPRGLSGGEGGEGLGRTPGATEGGHTERRGTGTHGAGVSRAAQFGCHVSFLSLSVGQRSDQGQFIHTKQIIVPGVFASLLVPSLLGSVILRGFRSAFQGVLLTLFFCRFRNSIVQNVVLARVMPASRPSQPWVFVPRRLFGLPAPQQSKTFRRPSALDEKALLVFVSSGRLSEHSRLHLQ